MPRIADLTGHRFGRWTVLSIAGRSAARKATWNCVCDCGATAVVISGNLRSGTSQSCGCHKLDRIRETKFLHGRDTRDPTYASWGSMISRCERRMDYMVKGITVCDRWKTDFLAFLADMGERPKGRTLDRIDNDKGYEPGNCRWATSIEQRRNSSNIRPITFNGETLLITEWEDRLGFGRAVLTKRLKRGWSIERALTTPALPNGQTILSAG